MLNDQPISNVIGIAFQSHICTISFRHLFSLDIWSLYVLIFYTYICLFFCYFFFLLRIFSNDVFHVMYSITSQKKKKNYSIEHIKSMQWVWDGACTHHKYRLQETKKNHRTISSKVTMWILHKKCLVTRKLKLVVFLFVRQFKLLHLCAHNEHLNTAKSRQVGNRCLASIRTCI